MGKCRYKRAAHAPWSSLALLLTALLPDLILAGTSSPAQRLSRLDIAGHCRICGGGNRFPPLHSFPHPLGFFDFTPFFLSLALSFLFFFFSFLSHFFLFPPAAVPAQPLIPGSLK